MSKGIKIISDISVSRLALEMDETNLLILMKMVWWMLDQMMTYLVVFDLIMCSYFFMFTITGKNFYPKECTA